MSPLVAAFTWNAAAFYSTHLRARAAAAYAGYQATRYDDTGRTLHEHKVSFGCDLAYAYVVVTTQALAEATP